jgi:uroporphyrinogen-III synthase
MRLLVTRPEPDARRTADTLRARGHAAVLAPLLRLESIYADLGSGPWAMVLMTSANAARAIAGHPRMGEIAGLPALAVGRHSADAARDVGFRDVTSADGAAPDLVRITAARALAPNLRVLYLAGQDRSHDLGAELGAHGIEVRTAVVYRAVPVRRLTDDVLSALAAGRIEGALHYSRRSATTLLQAAAAGGVLNAVLSLAHYCLSSEIATLLRDAGANRMQVASRPEESALLELLPST